MTKTLQGKLLGNNPHEPNENTLNKILTNQKQHCKKEKSIMTWTYSRMQSSSRFENQLMLFNTFTKEMHYIMI